LGSGVTPRSVTSARASGPMATIRDQPSRRQAAPRATHAFARSYVGESEARQPEAGATAREGAGAVVLTQHERGDPAVRAPTSSILTATREEVRSRGGDRRVRFVSDHVDRQTPTSTTSRAVVGLVSRRRPPLTIRDLRVGEFASWGSPVRARHAPSPQTA